MNGMKQYEEASRWSSLDTFCEAVDMAKQRFEAVTV